MCDDSVDTDAPDETDVPVHSDNPPDTDDDAPDAEGCEGCAQGGAPSGVLLLLGALGLLRRRR